MSTIFEAKKYPFGSQGEKKIIRTTLGELVVAVTDEVVPLVRDRSALYKVVSRVVNHLLARRVQKRSRRKYPASLASA
jgi:hypothetical protein